MKDSFRMEQKPFKPTKRNHKQLIVIAAASAVLVSAIAYFTVTLLHRFNAPTLLSDTSDNSSTPAKQTPPTVEQANTVADTAYESASKKVSAGDQEGALAEYKTAYKNYLEAKNTQRADDAEFAIKSIEAVLEVSKNPTKPSGPRAAAKE